MQTSKFNSKRIEALKAQYLKSQYVISNWEVDKEDDLTLEEYATFIDPRFDHIDGNPIIIAKTRNSDGKVFLKMKFFLEGGGEVDYDLSYKRELSDKDVEEGIESIFHEDDEVDINTILFRTEKYLGKTHSYVTGKIVKE